MTMFSHDDELDDEELSRIEEILRDAETSTQLTPWEDEFCDSLRDRVAIYGARTRISDKQMEIIDRIERKLWRL